MLLPYGEHEPQIAADVYIAPGAAIIGDVALGAESSVWFNTTIRGDVQPIRIGARTSIQDNSVIHATDGWAPTLVGEDCVVGHGVILHGCTLGNRVLVGMGTIILDAAKIGDDVLIGAGSLVTARTEIPSGTLVMGRPAKVKRELTDAERESIQLGAVHYVQKTHAYRGD
ncbi:MAG: gamma carbonic anhydrase family protein [Deltaproteobacteria bacterium]|nr:gamma carbonic anhydrase family protein [Deltaproteobacteria bacterium]